MFLFPFFGIIGFIFYINADGGMGEGISYKIRWDALMTATPPDVKIFHLFPFIYVNGTTDYVYIIYIIATKTHTNAFVQFAQNKVFVFVQLFSLKVLTNVLKCGKLLLSKGTNKKQLEKVAFWGDGC